MICPLCLEELPRDLVLYRALPHECTEADEDQQELELYEAELSRQENLFDSECALGYR